MLTLAKFSVGVGDRFAHQAKAQLRACLLAAEKGVEVIPVWNKSNREHTIIGSEPSTVRAAADAAVKELGWTKPYHVDADHIRLETVDRFLACSDFFTIDVADSIGKPAAEKDVTAFVDRHPELTGTVTIAGIAQPFQITRSEVARVAAKYLLAVQDAGKIYRYIAGKKGGEDRFIAEVSMDETDAPQTPPELLIILAALADEGVRLVPDAVDGDRRLRRPLRNRGAAGARDGEQVQDGQSEGAPSAGETGHCVLLTPCTRSI